MSIKWNKITWYSKLVALILFAALPFIGFYFGVKYEKLREEARSGIMQKANTYINKQ